MTIEEAADTAQGFLKNYVMNHNFFTPDEEMEDPEDSNSLRLFFFRAVVFSNIPNTILYSFSYGRHFHKDDPELIELLHQCMDALKEAHPELSNYRSRISIN